MYLVLVYKCKSNSNTANISPDTICGDLTDEEINRIRTIIDDRLSN